MTSNDIQLEVLPTTQRKMLRSLGPFADQHRFFLVGGTAVALHLGHRRSVDLDWFTHDDIDDPHQFAARLVAEGFAWKTKKIAPGTLHGTVEGINVSFLSYPYPLLDELVDISGFDCRMASLEDLAAMKLAALAQRGTKKDFVDIWALARHGFDLSQMVAWYRQKYATDDVFHLISSLSYFEDADPEPMPRMLVDGEWETIKDVLRDLVKDYAG